jgi:hypothetical protein
VDTLGSTLFVIVVVLACVGFVKWFRSGAMHRQRLERFRRARRVLVSQAAGDGEVAIEGTVRATQGLARSRLSDREAVVVNTGVSRATGSDSHPWARICEEWHVRDFELEDAQGGRVQVPVRDARYYLPSHRLTSLFWTRPTGAFAAFLTTHHVTIGRAHLRFWEQRIEAGDRVRVVGRVERVARPQEGAGWRDASSQLSFVSSSDESESLLVTTYGEGRLAARLLRETIYTVVGMIILTALVAGWVAALSRS